MAESSVTVDQVLTLLKRFTSASGVELTAQTPLLSTGLIDSLSVAEVAESLNEEFNAKLDITDLGVDNADNAAQLTSLVNAKLS